MNNEQTSQQIPKEASHQVSGPSIGLLITGILGGIFAVTSLIAEFIGTGIVSMWGDNLPERYLEFYEGGAAIGSSFVGLLVAAFIIFAGLKMKDLQQWGLAVAASILAMIPCISPCCVIGLPIGIWCLVVLTRTDVKAAFT